MQVPSLEMGMTIHSSIPIRIPIPVFLLGEYHGQRSLVACSPWGQKESDVT